jgi:putative flippase GtrA
MKDAARAARFVANGLLAAGVHFAVLWLLIERVGLPSAGLANLLAAVVGITVSFLGNRHFVFRAASGPWRGQALRFVGLYAATALMHGAVVFGWTDMAGWDYRGGFLLATGLQVIVSYLGNRRLVFRAVEE